MLFGAASAVAVLSFTSSVVAQVNTQTCPFTPAWNPCVGRSDRDCATIQVPKDWQNKDAGYTPLNLIRIRSTNANAQSVIVNPGGPGSSGINYILNDRGTGDPSSLQS